MHVEDNLLIDFGETVRNLRKGKGFSQEELAFQAGVHRTYIGMIERGEKNVTLNNIKKLADALGVSMSEVFSQLELKWK